jgi:hypothetical protein
VARRARAQASGSGPTPNAQRPTPNARHMSSSAKNSPMGPAVPPTVLLSRPFLQPAYAAGVLTGILF